MVFRVANLLRDGQQGIQRDGGCEPRRRERRAHRRVTIRRTIRPQSLRSRDDGADFIHGIAKRIPRIGPTHLLRRGVEARHQRLPRARAPPVGRGAQRVMRREQQEPRDGLGHRRAPRIIRRHLPYQLDAAKGAESRAREPRREFPAPRSREPHRCVARVTFPRGERGESPRGLRHGHPVTERVEKLGWVVAVFNRRANPSSRREAHRARRMQQQQRARPLRRHLSLRLGEVRAVVCEQSGDREREHLRVVGSELGHRLRVKVSGVWFNRLGPRPFLRSVARAGVVHRGDGGDDEQRHRALRALRGLRRAILGGGGYDLHQRGGGGALG